MLFEYFEEEIFSSPLRYFSLSVPTKQGFNKCKTPSEDRQDSVSHE